MSSSCPFCKCLDLFVCELDYDIGFSVLCLKCGASGPQGDTDKIAWAAWEERPEEGEMPLHPSLLELQ